MQLSFFLMPLLSLAVLAKDQHASGQNSTEAQCKRFLKNERLVQLAANDTLLAEITNNNATRIDFIKKKAAEVQPQIDTAKQNATLMATCDQVRAIQQENGQCRFMKRMERLQKLVANETALNEVTKNNATKADKLKSWAQQGQAKLTQLQGNQTLLQYCAAMTTKGDCKKMNRLSKIVALSKNDTALNDKFNGNTTKIENFKAKAAKKEAQLNEMMNNSTLMSVCKQLKDGKGGNSGNGGKTDGTKNGIDSGAAGVRAAGALSLAAILSVVVGLLM
ncbi:hypothetical protein CGRA01v4_11803 [Colletotrichum graminicola]|uniref:Uncharacterized protein n=1 Tax=Colletotrichum graminicola (strain M1.001 / M2 / FGSC 10212) TaxID=645133 RepID=E3QBX0_COLGM|nr:uncharacterized protein GLRG_03349 [Colletotrichum graminicola M1.001]EFQ28205.1 hypothetical protein GLRG_03349 [Colletotrichum graminicola M1.001]WDK20516.1 hypothetical protein CGRA01v4_11803 [Colletotrichum graminicola]